MLELILSLALSALQVQAEVEPTDANLVTLCQAEVVARGSFDFPNVDFSPATTTSECEL